MNSNVSTLRTSSQLSYRLGGTTDPGSHGAENQDRYLIGLHPKDDKSVIMAVIDGHGSHGSAIADVVKKFLWESLTTPEALDELRSDPTTKMSSIFQGMHGEAESIIARNQWSDRGGATATVVVILHGEILIHSHVGDSSCMFTGFGDIHPFILASTWEVPNMEKEASHSFIIDAGHNATSKRERDRMATMCPHPTLEGEPHMKFQFASHPSMTGQWYRNHSEPPDMTIWERTSDGSFRAKVEGSDWDNGPQVWFKKNVMGEWATQIQTPDGAPDNAILAMTRALGDILLRPYGLTHEPDTVVIDLKGLITTRPLTTLFIDVASDGVWDAQTPSEVAAQLCNFQANDRVNSIVKSFMNTNKRKYKTLFGGEADNMTLVHCQIHIETEHEGAVEDSDN